VGEARRRRIVGDKSIKGNGYKLLHLRSKSDWLCRFEYDQKTGALITSWPGYHKRVKASTGRLYEMQLSGEIRRVA